MWKRVLLYGVLLAAGTLALQWLDYLRLARAHSGDIVVVLIAVAFLALGIVIGVRASTLTGLTPPLHCRPAPEHASARGVRHRRCG